MPKMHRRPRNDIPRKRPIEKHSWTFRCNLEANGEALKNLTILVVISLAKLRNFLELCRDTGL